MLLMIANADGRILEYGQRPWANEDAMLPTSTILEIERASLPAGDPRDFRYVKGVFVLDPLPPTPDELDRADARDIPTLLAQIDAYQTRIAQGQTALANATTLVKMQPIVAGLLQLQADQLALWRLLVKVVGKLV